MTGQEPLACSFIHSTNNSFVLGTVLGAGDTAVNTADKNSCLLVVPL